MIYEWDEQKRAANIEKHGLDFARADLVFESALKVTIESRKSRGETRLVDHAEVEGVILALVYTLRDDAVRIMSFRPAKKRERREYDAALKNR